MEPATPSCAWKCDGPRSCDRVYDQDSLLVWAAIYRNDCELLTAEERKECPMLRCGERFSDHEKMLKHLSSCNKLSSQEYWCYECGRAEKFDKERKELSSRSQNAFQRFGQICIGLIQPFQKKKSAQLPDPTLRFFSDSVPLLESSLGNPLHPAELPAFNEIYEIDSPEPPMELDSVEIPKEFDSIELPIMELDSVEITRESQGLFAGIQYLNAVSDLVDPKESSTPIESPGDLIASQSSDNPLALDFKNPHTFRFLDKAISGKVTTYQCPHCSYYPRGSPASWKGFMKRHMNTFHSYNHVTEAKPGYSTLTHPDFPPRSQENCNWQHGYWMAEEPHHSEPDNFQCQEGSCIKKPSGDGIHATDCVEKSGPGTDGYICLPGEAHCSEVSSSCRNVLKDKCSKKPEVEAFQPPRGTMIEDITETSQGDYLDSETSHPYMDTDDTPAHCHPLVDAARQLSRSFEGAESQTQQNHQVPKHGPKIEQWISLWRLRRDLRELHKALMQVTHSSALPQARKVRRLYKDATHMLETGLSTFLEVLDGTVPSTLQKVLALVAVSQVMWNAVLNENASKGVVNHHDPLDGLSTWRLAIADSQDQIVLDHIANELWDIPIPTTCAETDTQAVLHEDPDLADLKMHPLSYSDFIEPRDRNSFSGGRSYAGQGNPGPMPHNLLQTLQDDVSLLFSTTAAHSSLLFSDFLDVPGFEGDILPPRRTTPTAQMANSSTQTATGNSAIPDDGIFGRPIKDNFIDLTLNISAGSDGTINPDYLQLRGPPIWDSSGQPMTMDSQRASLSAAASFDWGRNFAQCLTGTVIFQVVMLFLKIMYYPGSILQVLSGCRSNGSGNESNDVHERASAREGSFLADMREHAIEPLRAKFSEHHIQFVGLLESGYSLMKLGCIGSLQEFEHYLVHTGLHLSNSKNDFMFFLQSVLSQCLKCSSKMSWNDIYRDGVCADQYSNSYLDRRLKQEEAAADTIFVTPNTSDPTVFSIISGSTTSGTIKSPSNFDMFSPSSSSGTDNSKPRPEEQIARCSHQGCGNVYTGVDARINLRRHVRCKHEAREWKCPGRGCELATPRRDNLRKHFKIKHPGEIMPTWLANKKRC